MSIDDYSLIYHHDPKTAPKVEKLGEDETIILSSVPVGEQFRVHVVMRRSDQVTIKLHYTKEGSTLKIVMIKGGEEIPYVGGFPFPVPSFAVSPLLHDHFISCVLIDGNRYNVKDIEVPKKTGRKLKGEKLLKKFNFTHFNLVLVNPEAQILLESVLFGEGATPIPVPEFIPVTANPRPMIQKIKKVLQKDFEEELMGKELDFLNEKLDVFSQQRFHRYLAPIVAICKFYWKHEWNEELVSEDEKTFTIKLPKGVSSLRGKSLVGKAASQVKKDIDELGSTRFTLLTPAHSYAPKKGKKGKKKSIEYLISKFVLVTATYERAGERNGKPYHRLVSLECSKKLIRLVQRDSKKQTQTGFRMFPDIYDLLEKHPKQKYDYHYLFVGWCFSGPKFERETRKYSKLCEEWGIKNKKNPQREPERFEELIEFGKELGLLVNATRKGDNVELHFDPRLIPRLSEIEKQAPRTQIE